MKYNGVYDTTKRRAGCSYTNDGANFSTEVGGEDSHAGHKETACSDADAKSLSKKDLPVCMAETQHHLAEDKQEAADKEQFTEIASIVDGTCKGADHHEKESLDGAYP